MCGSLFEAGWNGVGPLAEDGQERVGYHTVACCCTDCLILFGANRGDKRMQVS